MSATNVELPEARIQRKPRWYLKDKVFLFEIGAALTFLGLMLMMAVGAQRDPAELEKDPFASQMFLIIVLVCFVFSISSLGGAIERVWLKGERPKTFLRRLGTLAASTAVAVAIVGFASYGVTRLILLLQGFFAWLGMSAGFTLAYLNRRKPGDTKEPG